MRIEILVGSEDPLIFPLSSSKVTLGSGENCDIVVSASGISRKHLSIATEDDQYFVIDQGSTNGSFINEERLVPGRKIEFTSFFPVRLGDNVLVSLLSDEEDMGSDFSIPVPKERTSPGLKAPSKERDDVTTVINLKDLKKARTENLVLERNQKREIRKKVTPAKKTPSKQKKKPNYVSWAAGLLVIGAAYYNFFVIETETNEKTYREVGKVIEAPSVNVKPELPKVNEDLVTKDDLPTKEHVNGLLTNIKCSIDVETYLCNIIQGAKSGEYGVTQVGLSVYILIDGTSYLEDARKYVRNVKDKELLRNIGAYIFLMRHLPQLDENLMGDSRIIIALFLQNESGPFVDTIIALRPKVFNREKSKFVEGSLRHIRDIGASALKPASNFYTVY